jgi:uncharacterized protein with FMN-binding domain
VQTKKLAKIILVVLLVAVLGFGVKYGLDLTGYRRAIGAITIGNVDLSLVPDGTYTGSVETIWVGATVNVQVKDHRIIDIGLDHRHDRGAAAEVVVARVLEEQSLQVDMVTGATSSSKVILKAIEKALSSALN